VPAMPLLLTRSSEAEVVFDKSNFLFRSMVVEKMAFEIIGDNEGVDSDSVSGWSARIPFAIHLAETSLGYWHGERRAAETVRAMTAEDTDVVVASEIIDRGGYEWNVSCAHYGRAR